MECSTRCATVQRRRRRRTYPVPPPVCMLMAGWWRWSQAAVLLMRSEKHYAGWTAASARRHFRRSAASDASLPIGRGRGCYLFGQQVNRNAAAAALELRKINTFASRLDSRYVWGRRGKAANLYCVSWFDRSGETFFFLIDLGYPRRFLWFSYSLLNL